MHTVQATTHMELTAAAGAHTRPAAQDQSGQSSSMCLAGGGAYKVPLLLERLLWPGNGFWEEEVGFLQG